MGTDLTRTYDTPFIGREVDLAISPGGYSRRRVAGSFGPARHRRRRTRDREEPDRRRARGHTSICKPDVTTWRQGRCLPLRRRHHLSGPWGELLKAHAGILESDTTSVASGQSSIASFPRAKSSRVVPSAATPAARHRSVVVRRARGAVHRLATVPPAHRRPRPRSARLRGSALGRRIHAGVPGTSDRSRRGRGVARGRDQPDPSCSSGTRTTRTACRTRHSVNLNPALGGRNRAPGRLPF